MRPVKNIFIDPAYKEFYGNKMFSIDNPYLNRDNQLLPFIRLKESLNKNNITINTADFLSSNEIETNCEYYSLGLLGYRNFMNRGNIKLKSFLIMEPPLVANHLYKLLPELTSLFENVYIYNTIGDGYSLENVNQSKLKKLYFDQPWDDVLVNYWENINRQNRIVAISGNHNPRFRKPEYYSLRVKAMIELAKYDAIDLYGKGWDIFWSKQTFWPYFLKSRKQILSIYKGVCSSKHKILSDYKYALCIENAPMRGYITEKIFDCFYSGTVPIYLGAPDISKYIPEKCYIDARDFSNWAEIWSHIKKLTDVEWQTMREEARFYISSVESFKNYKFYENVIR